MARDWRRVIDPCPARGTGRHLPCEPAAGSEGHSAGGGVAFRCERCAERGSEGGRGGGRTSWLGAGGEGVDDPQAMSCAPPAPRARHLCVCVFYVCTVRGPTGRVEWAADGTSFDQYLTVLEKIFDPAGSCRPGGARRWTRHRAGPTTSTPR